MTKGLVALVNSKPAITDMIGNRFFPVLLPQGLSTFPAAAYRWYNNVGNEDFDGASTYDFGYTDIQCYGKNYADAVKVWKLMRKDLEDTTGIFGGVDIRDIRYMDSGTEDYLDDLELHTKQLELKISYLRLT